MRSRFTGLTVTFLAVALLPAACSSDARVEDDGAAASSSSGTATNQGGGGTGQGGGAGGAGGAGTTSTGGGGAMASSTGSGGAPGTTDPTNYCTAKMSCEMGNAADLAACIVEVNVNGQLAAVRGCTPPFAAVLGCLEQNSSCEMGIYTPEDDCDTELVDFSTCNEAATSPVGPTPMVSPLVTSLCDIITGCTQMGPLDLPTCRIQGQGELDRAAAYGCQTQMEAFFNCVLMTGTCVNGVFEYSPSCDQQLMAAQDCIIAASDLL